MSAGRLLENGLDSSVTVVSPKHRRSRMERLVLCDSALKTTSMLVELLTIWLSIAERGCKCQDYLENFRKIFKS